MHVININYMKISENKKKNRRKIKEGEVFPQSCLRSCVLLEGSERFLNPVTGSLHPRVTGHKKHHPS